MINSRRLLLGKTLNDYEAAACDKDPPTICRRQHRSGRFALECGWGETELFPYFIRAIRGSLFRLSNSVNLYELINSRAEWNV